MGEKRNLPDPPWNGDRSASRVFPFKSTLSLDPLIKFWHEVPLGDDRCLVTGFARNIRKELEKTPELAGPIDDLGVLERHKDLLYALMTPVFPPASWELDFMAAIPPFVFHSFYSTPKFDRKQFFVDGKITGGMNLTEEEFRYGVGLRAYSAILMRFYDIDLFLEYPLISTIPDGVTGLDRYYRWQINPRFVEIRTKGPLKELTTADRRRVYENIANLDILSEILPPENFEFYGFTVFNAVDVTDQEALSSLRLELIERDTLVSQSGFKALQQKLRVMFRRPDLVLGLACFPGENDMLLQLGLKIGHSFILDDSCRGNCEDARGSVYERVIEQKEPIVVEDLTAIADTTPIEQGILGQGIRNLIVAPLMYHGQNVGILELGSKNPGDLSSISLLRLKEVLPLFAAAVRRALEESDTRVQAVMKEQFTAIHPSVEWKFLDAARKFLMNQVRNTPSEMEPILFKEVYPLYGLSDIRGSSLHRNHAIQADLVDQLSLGREIILEARRFKPLPILDELSYRIGRRIESISAGLDSGDESSVLEFLHQDVESLFGHLMGYDQGVRDRIEAYRQALDPDLRILYRRRKDFEESVTALNETVTAYLEEEEVRAQEMFPHYFEKYKSDGVDHTMYIGREIVHDGSFDFLYLRNLRLWQLLMMCGIARKVDRLKSQLKVPLEISSLILVQNTPMSIRFRADEKKFDVDGAYNVRYEIIKKRIDKAIVEGKEERLTQTGKIAIVYSHPREAAEYREYVEFLTARGFLTGEMESLDLQELQGVQGLRALRVAVNMEAEAVEAAAMLGRIEDAVKAMVHRAFKD